MEKSRGIARPESMMARATITLPRALIERLRVIGEGNVSAGVRKLLEEERAER